MWRGWGDSFVSENGLKFLMQFNWSGEKGEELQGEGCPGTVLPEDCAITAAGRDGQGGGGLGQSYYLSMKESQK